MSHCASTMPALAIRSFIEEGGSALAPLIAGLIAVRSSLQNAILTICITAWVLCSILFPVAAHLVPRDIETLRAQMRERAEIERAAQGALYVMRET